MKLVAKIWRANRLPYTVSAPARRGWMLELCDDASVGQVVVSTTYHASKTLAKRAAAAAGARPWNY